MKIEVKEIKKSFGRKTVLDGVSFEVSEGTCIGILGENGSGKSTLFSVLTGLQRGDGAFYCNGTDLIKDTKLRSKMVGFVPQSPPLINELSAKDNLKLWYSKDDLEQEPNQGVLKLLGIDEFYKVSVNKMSGGMKKRLSIGCAVAHQPKVLFLDEPSAALDLVCKEKIIDYLEKFKSEGGIVIIATHDIYELVMCDQIYLLKGGKLEAYNGNREIHSLVKCLQHE